MTDYYVDGAVGNDSYDESGVDWVPINSFVISDI